MRDQKLQAISALFLGFPSQERTEDEKALGRVYLMAVDDIPEGFVAMACKRFIQAQVERSNLTWRPTPAELAFEARRLHYRAIDDDHRRLARLPKPPSDDPPEATAEERARAAEMWDLVRQEIAAAADARAFPQKYAYRRPTRTELIASRDRIAAATSEEQP